MRILFLVNVSFSKLFIKRCGDGDKYNNAYAPFGHGVNEAQILEAEAGCG